MTVVIQDISPRKQYVAILNQVDYVFPFQVYVATDLNVYSRTAGSAPNDPANKLVYVTDYTVALNPSITPGGPAEGGTVTLVDPSLAGDIVTVVRNEPDQRLNYYQNGGLFDATIVNPDFNQTILMIQQAMMYINSLIPHYNVNASPDPNNLIDQILPTLPAGYVWMKNTAGTAIEAVPFSGGIAPIEDNWVGTNGNTQMVVGAFYYTTGGGTLVLTLPTACVAGQLFRIAGYGSTGWTLAQNALQKIYFGNTGTTIGVGGSISSTNANDTIELVCTVANTRFVVLSSIGNLIVV